MKGPDPIRRWVVGALGTVAALALVVAAYGLTRSSDEVVGPGPGPTTCTQAVRALATRLSELPELDLAAPRTRPLRAPTQDCDFGEVTAERRFESTGGPAAVLAHYRTVLPARGWRPVPSPYEDDPIGTTCFRRTFEGRTAFLQVEFPWEDGLDTTKYSLEVWAATSFNAEEACWRDG